LAAIAAVTALAAAAPAAAAPAQGAIVNAGGEGAIAGDYIVTLKSSAPRGIAATAQTLASRHRASIKRTYASALTGFNATMSEADAKQLAADPAVFSVEQNHKKYATGTQTNPPSWGLDRLDQRNLPLNSSYTYPNTASNVTAYVIDTGILTTHSTFGGRATSGWDAVDNDSNATDCNGHGTHVAGTVGGTQYGVAKGVKLVGVRVLDCAGSGDDAGVIAGIDWVTANKSGPSVANMSLGGSASAALDAAVRKSIAAGITYAIAAGNDGANACGDSPARVTEAITVGATSRTDARASWSNYGSCLDIFAPGVSITSSWIGGSSATQTIDGTSMASPHVAGAAALYVSANPTATPQQVRDGLVNAATSGLVTGPGTGSPNKLLNVGGGTTEPPTGKYFENATAVSIPDYPGSAVTSAITVTGVSGNAPSVLKVGVDIKHTYSGDLKVDLIAPDGSVYNLVNRTGGSAANIIQTFTVNASSELANGAWKLRVQDLEAQDVGKIAKFSLQF
jgi:subtilisin family serine protease